MTKNTTYTTIEVDLDEQTQEELIRIGCERFNDMSDDQLRHLMLEYGATCVLKDRLGHDRDEKFSPISLHANSYVGEEQKDAVLPCCDLPTVELASIYMEAIDAFLHVSNKETDIYSYLTPDEIRANKIRAWKKMSVKSKLKFLDGLIDGLV